MGERAERYALVAVNTLKAQYYKLDSASSYASRLDIMPNPDERFHTNLTVSYRYLDPLAAVPCAAGHSGSRLA